MRAIPRSILIHTATMAQIKTVDRWGKEELINPTELSCVRIEPVHKIMRDKNNAEVQIEAVLFYDCKNSCPRGVTFREDDIVDFQGQKHRVKTVEPLYDGKRLHHYEIGLVKYG